MPTTEDCRSGRILYLIRRACFLLNFTGLPVAGPVLGKLLEQEIQPFGIRVVTLAEAGKMLEESGHCAAGRRICQPLFPDTPATEAVFLGSLADSMVAEGKARIVPSSEAYAILKKYPDQPLVISKVSGEYCEICRSVVDVCMYWAMKRKGLRV